MRTTNPLLLLTLGASLAGCASAGSVLGGEPGAPSAPSTPEAPRQIIAQVLAVADPLQVEVGPMVHETQESGQGSHAHSKHHHGHHGGQSHPGHQGSHSHAKH
jgi:hypothetical protein